jgi:UDP-2,4-diacetamido-2,4,6-trideoxy-beta-L-altropyranose hydrolase
MASSVTRRATIIADAGPVAGLGHLSRAGAAAVALRCHGIEVDALMLGETRPVVRDGIRWTPVGEPPRAVEGIAIVDSYALDAAAATAVRGTGPLLAFADDSREPPEADLLVGYGLDDPRALDGAAHACLRPMFWGVPRAAPAPEVRRVLVSVGASEIAGGPALADAVAAALPGAEVRFVAGPYAEAPPGGRVAVVRAPSDLLDELLAADLVVSAAGQTMLEAACAGTPCVAVELAENQRRQLHALADAGAVVPATPDTAADAVAALAADPERRRALAERAPVVVDGFGALRLAWRLVAEAGR